MRDRTTLQVEALRRLAEQTTEAYDQLNRSLNCTKYTKQILHELFVAAASRVFDRAATDRPKP